MSPTPPFGNNCQHCIGKHEHEHGHAGFPENVSKTSARDFLDNFLVIKLCSTTEQMPALVTTKKHGDKGNSAFVFVVHIFGTPRG
jgi:hypothetical protein